MKSPSSPKQLERVLSDPTTLCLGFPRRQHALVHEAEEGELTSVDAVLIDEPASEEATKDGPEVVIGDLDITLGRIKRGGYV